MKRALQIGLIGLIGLIGPIYSDLTALAGTSPTLGEEALDLTAASGNPLPRENPLLHRKRSPSPVSGEELRGTVSGEELLEVVRFEKVETWTGSELAPYVGQTIRFAQPVYVCNNYYSNVDVSLHRVMSPTNQALPGSSAYQSIVALNPRSTVTLTGLSGYHRMGEVLTGLTVYVSSTSSVRYVSHEGLWGTREDLATAPTVDMLGEHDLLVCAFNLEYYLVETLGQDRGPKNASESARQHAKIMDALTHIGADIYGFVEVEQGQAALQKLSESLSAATGRRYTWINDGMSASGTFTKSGYVYCSDVVKPFGEMKSNNANVANRKKMQAFDVLETGERFIFSLNHFKAKSGSASGLDADQGDGQGSYSYTRTMEAQSVLSSYQTNKNWYKDEDLLIMGDLNAYAMEDPIRALTDGGMTDLHRYFHADSSYSYTYRGTAGYLDHALCNATLLPQVTGMAAYHINSDEHDRYTYDQSSDETMFRSSDHDPVLVGLRLGAEMDERIPNASAAHMKITVEQDGQVVFHYAEGGYYTVHTVSGYLLGAGDISTAEYRAPLVLPRGIYVFNVYVEDTVCRRKLVIL